MKNLLFWLGFVLGASIVFHSSAGAATFTDSTPFTGGTRTYYINEAGTFSSAGNAFRFVVYYTPAQVSVQRWSGSLGYAPAYTINGASYSYSGSSEVRSYSNPSAGITITQGGHTIIINGGFAPPNTIPFSLSLANNTDTDITVSVNLDWGTMLVPAYGTASATRNVVGAAGATITVDPEPTWLENYDPLLVPPTGTLERLGRYGEPAEEKLFTVIYFNWGPTTSADVSFGPGKPTIGSQPAAGITGTPAASNYRTTRYDFLMPGTANLYFTIPTATNLSQSKVSKYFYVVDIERPEDVPPPEASSATEGGSDYNGNRPGTANETTGQDSGVQVPGVNQPGGTVGTGISSDPQPVAGGSSGLPSGGTRPAGEDAKTGDSMATRTALDALTAPDPGTNYNDNFDDAKADFDAMAAASSQIKGNVNARIGELEGSAPSFPIVNGSTGMSFEVPFPAPIGTIQIDLSRFSGWISVFRLFLEVGFLFFAFFLTSRTLRSARI